MKLGPDNLNYTLRSKITLAVRSEKPVESMPSKWSVRTKKSFDKTDLRYVVIST